MRTRKVAERGKSETRITFKQNTREMMANETESSECSFYYGAIESAWMDTEDKLSPSLSLSNSSIMACSSSSDMFSPRSLHECEYAQYVIIVEKASN